MSDDPEVTDYLIKSMTAIGKVAGQLIRENPQKANAVAAACYGVMIDCFRLISTPAEIVVWLRAHADDLEKQNKPN